MEEYYLNNPEYLKEYETEDWRITFYEASDIDRSMPKEFIQYFNMARKYDTKNSQFIEGEGYNDVAWVDCGSDIYVMYREAIPNHRK